MTLVAVPLAAATADALLADTRRAHAAGADLVEWRLDTAITLGADPQALIAAIPRSPLPVLLTIRHASEKGEWSGTEEQRVALLAAADLAGAAYIDVELAHDRGWRPSRARLILSSHDFNGMGEDLAAQLVEMERRGAIAKVAVTARDAADLHQVRELLLARPGERIVLAMGEHGLPSRLLAGVWGGLLTFARLPDQAGSAPGQPAVTDLLGMYRLRQQQPSWRVLGVIGSPIAHSLSPLIHNAALAAQDVPAVYVPFRVEDPRAFWQACRDWLGGISITIPHTQELMAVVDELEPLARSIGAMNTIARDASGRTVGANTDAAAIIACVEGGLGGPVAGKTVLCLGAGGVSRAIAHALASRGARVAITNRTAERAAQLAAEVGGTALTAEQALTFPYDVLVNGTAVGMGKPLETPWPATHLRAGTVVFDTVYTPLETRLLREARAAGACTVPGLDMFIHQAAEQYRRFTGNAAPVALMRSAALARLAPVSAQA